MIFKALGKFFQYISGFISDSLLKRLRRGTVHLEDQQLKSTENPQPQAAQEQHQVPASDNALAQPEQEESRQEPAAENQPLQTVQEQTTAETPQDQPLLQTPENQEVSAEIAAQPSSPNSPQLKSAIESLLFVAAAPLSLDRLKGIFEEFTQDQIESQIEALRDEYDARGSGILLAEVAGGYQLVTKPENAGWIRKFRSVKASSKLSRPALETLAIIAYKQPITRTEVEAIRGVNIGGIVRNLMERRLVKIVGKKDIPGKPMLYGTSQEFLQYFGLRDLSALPTLKEFQELEPGEEVMEELSPESADAAPEEEPAAAESEASQAEPVSAAANRENSAG